MHVIRQLDRLFEISMAPRQAEVGQKWKIQMAGGEDTWGDMKAAMLEAPDSDQEDQYETQYFDTHEEAQDEIASMFDNSVGGGISGSPDDFRIVTADTPSTTDFY